MPRRLDFAKISPAALKTMLDIEAYLAKCGLDHPLTHLIRMRASQINGCAYCLDMHSKDARAAGETEQRRGEACAGCGKRRTVKGAMNRSLQQQWRTVYDERRDRNIHTTPPSGLLARFPR
jgi:AhpD family alkylhydroperoxidase